MRRPLLVLVALAMLPSGTRADDGDIDDPDATPDPRILHAGGRLHGTSAKLTLRFLVSFPEGHGTRSYLDVPDDAHVTGAVVRYGATAHPLALMTADDASAAFGSLADLPGGPTRRWAITIAKPDAGQVELTIAAPRAGSLTLELEVEAPTCFFRDKRYVHVPEDWLPVIEPSLRVPATDPGAFDETCAGASRAWMAFPSPRLASRPAGADRVGASAARALLGDVHVAKLELAVAGKLGEIPRDLATVFVVDASLSMTAAQLDVQRELVAAYTRATPHARVQIIAYSRRAHALLPGWSVASQAALRIDRELRGLALHNGSNFDVGLAEAARWLARTSGVKRVVLVTDERIANRLLDAAPEIARKVPAGTLVHVVAASEDDAEPARDDDATLAGIAKTTRGMSIRTGLPKSFDPTLLLRPISLDNVEIKAPGWSPVGGFAIDACGEMLPEGDACTWWATGERVAGPIAIVGMVWGTKVVRVVQPDRAFGASVTREVSLMQGIDGEIVARAKEAARSVNAHWSLYVEWGGHHGYPDDAQLIGGLTCNCGGTMSGGFSTMGRTTGKVTPLPPLDLRDQLAAAVGRCGLGTHTVDARVETTKSEIVDVVVELEPGPPIDPQRARALEQCVADAIWDTTITIPAEFPHRTTHVEFGGA